MEIMISETSFKARLFIFFAIFEKVPLMPAQPKSGVNVRGTEFVLQQ